MDLLGLPVSSKSALWRAFALEGERFRSYQFYSGLVEKIKEVCGCCQATSDWSYLALEHLSIAGQSCLIHLSILGFKMARLGAPFFYLYGWL